MIVEYVPIYTSSGGWIVGKKTKTGNTQKPLSRIDVDVACSILNQGIKESTLLQSSPVGCPECHGADCIHHVGGDIGADGSEIKKYICSNCENQFSHIVKSKEVSS